LKENTLIIYVIPLNIFICYYFSILSLFCPHQSFVLSNKSLFKSIFLYLQRRIHSNDLLWVYKKIELPNEVVNQNHKECIHFVMNYLREHIKENATGDWKHDVYRRNTTSRSIGWYLFHFYQKKVLFSSFVILWKKEEKTKYCFIVIKKERKGGGCK